MVRKSVFANARGSVDGQQLETFVASVQHHLIDHNSSLHPSGNVTRKYRRCRQKKCDDFWSLNTAVFTVFLEYAEKSVTQVRCKLLGHTAYSIEQASNCDGLRCLGRVLCRHVDRLLRYTLLSEADNGCEMISGWSPGNRLAL